MKKMSKPSLKLARETVRSLSGRELSRAGGAEDFGTQTNQSVCFCVAETVVCYPVVSKACYPVPIGIGGLSNNTNCYGCVPMK